MNTASTPYTSRQISFRRLIQTLIVLVSLSAVALAGSRLIDHSNFLQFEPVELRAASVPHFSKDVSVKPGHTPPEVEDFKIEPSQVERGSSRQLIITSNVCATKTFGSA